MKTSRAPFFILLFTALLPASLCGDAFALAARETLDGDTLVLDSGERVRLIGIDAPEIHDNYGRNSKTAKYEGLYKAAVDVYAVEARAAAEEWVRGQKLVIKTDPANAKTDHRDNYGRLLGYVCRESDGRCLAEDLLSGGYALVYRRFNFERKASFLKLEETARRSSRGLWKHTTGRSKPSAGKNPSKKTTSKGSASKKTAGSGS